MHEARENPKRIVKSQTKYPPRVISNNWIAIPAFFFINWPIIFTPIVGDDLINPFDLYRQTNGSIIEVIKYTLDFGVYAHIAPIGMLTGGLWNYSWIASQELTGLSHQAFYIATKVVIYTLFIYTLQRFIKTLLPTNFSKRGLVEILSVLSLSALLQVHGLWSNDPVTNYPLAGMLSTIIGVWCIINFVNLMDRYTSMRFYSTASILLIASFWYEMNLGLLVALPVYYLIKKRHLKTQGMKTSFKVSRLIAMIGLPLFIYSTLRIANLDAAGRYDGTTVKLGLDLLQTWFLLNSSWIPFANAYTANYLNIPLNFKGGLIYFTQGALLIMATVYLIKNSKGESTLKNFVKNDGFNLVYKMVPFILYAFSATASHSLTPKYQNEINVLGQVYMSYSVVLIVVCAFLCVLILVTKFKPVILLVCGIAIANLAVNTSISETFNSSMERNNQLIKSLASENLQVRCDALENWKLMNWPDYYRDGMELGLKFTFKEIENSNFCSD
jgi:hypothetical protein